MDKYFNMQEFQGFQALEKRIALFWNESKAFDQSVHERNLEDEYVFYDGPPFANGLPHYGHLLTGFLKDTYARYHTMLGERVERRFGWDCHGLPAEMAAEKELGISGRAGVKEYGVRKFNEHCRLSVMRYADQWREYVNSQGRWVDFDNDYKTMSPEYMESVLWAFKALYDKGLVYHGARVMPYSWKCQTPVSNFEARMDNAYREKTSQSVFVAFEMEDFPSALKKKWGMMRRLIPTCKFVAWTTTPWTLPSNLALAVNPRINYLIKVLNGCAYIIAEGTEAKFLTKSPQCHDTKLETTRLRLVYFTLEDFDWFYQIHQDEEIKENNFGDLSRDELMRLFEYYLEHEKQYNFSIYKVIEKSSGNCIGYAGARMNSISELGDDIPGMVANFKQEYRSLGYGPESLIEMNRWIFDNTQYDFTIHLNELEHESLHKILKMMHHECIGIVTMMNPVPGRDEIYKQVCMKITRERFEEVFYISGEALVGCKYKPLFDDFANHENAFRVLSGDFVNTEDGTGIVHIAPGFGEDDFNLCQKHEIEYVCPVDEAGKFTSEVKDFEGMQVFDANVEVIKYLKRNGNWLHTEQYKHNYPHCWRTDTPLIYKVIESWYLKVSVLRDRLVELNQEINWIPDHVRDGRFGKWLENAKDWSISRNRFWGAPIPVWRSDDSKYPRIDVYGSIEELEKDFDVKVNDLHYLNDLTRINPDDPTGKSKMIRVEEVLDCWFESGSMPFAQLHYPFENKEKFERNFPADFVTEYVSQTRGWFYTMHVMAVALFDKPAYKNCLCHGVVLDGEGKKLSKRLGNYVDPMELFKIYGSDALRFKMLSDSVSYGGDLMLEEDSVRDVLRLVIKQLSSAMSFFAMYANADSVDAKLINSVPQELMDRYLLHKTEIMINTIRDGLSQYNSVIACSAIRDFIEILNNWYIRRSRSRFWKSCCDESKKSAYDTLYTALNYFSVAAASILPFTCEAIYQNLNHKMSLDSECVSVHLERFPEFTTKHDARYQEMDIVRDLCNAAHSIRNRNHVRIRQPLSCLTIYVEGVSFCDEILDIMRDEMNVKEIRVENTIESIAYVHLKPDFKKLAQLGLKKYMPNIIGFTKRRDASVFIEFDEYLYSVFDNMSIMDHQRLNVSDLRTCTYHLNEQHYANAEVVSCKVEHGNIFCGVMLNLKIDHMLELEGCARDIVRYIQNLRKGSDISIVDKISVRISSKVRDLQEIVSEFGEYIKTETLSSSILISDDHLDDISSNDWIDISLAPR